MKNTLKVLCLLVLILLLGCTKEDENPDETILGSTDCTEWNYFNSGCLSSLPNGSGSFEVGIRSNACIISETDDLITVKVIIEPTNGGISDDEEYEGIKIFFSNGEKIELSKSEFNNGGAIERTITAIKVTLDPYLLNNWTSASASLFVTAECIKTVVQNEKTVQELIDEGVSLDDIRKVYGFYYTDIYGKKYLDGIIIHLGINTSTGEILGGTVMAPQDHYEELNWDDAMATFPDSAAPGSHGKWAIPWSKDFEYMILNIVASTETHSIWNSPRGYYWTPEIVNDGFGSSAVGFYPEGGGLRFEAFKFREHKIRLIKTF